MMGGSKPVWHLEVTSGDLYLLDSDWFGEVRGSGSGYIWWCFANGNTCSKKLRIER